MSKFHVAAASVTIAALLTLPTQVGAKPRHASPVARHRPIRHAASRLGPVSTDPGHGRVETPVEGSYEGPGAEVFRRTILSTHAPGNTLELDRDAAQSATGGPSGGLPSNGSGP